MTKRLLVAFDIHGHGKLLLKLLDKADFNLKKDQLVLLGDYVNNGPDSVGTLKIVKSLHEQGAIVLLGNHEMRWLQDESPRIAVWKPFLRMLPFIKVIDDYIFVHAGIESSKAIDSQSKEIVTGYRKSHFPAFNSKKMTLIHGHIPTNRLGEQKGDIHVEGNKIAIDTGAGHNDYLSLLDLKYQRHYSINIENPEYVYVKVVKLRKEI